MKINIFKYLQLKKMCYVFFFLPVLTVSAQEELQTWSSKHAYIALGNLLTVCGTAQIDSCPMEGFVPEKYNEVLALEAHGLSSVLVLPVGYRAADDMFADFAKVRKTVAESILEL